VAAPGLIDLRPWRSFSQTASPVGGLVRILRSLGPLGFSVNSFRRGMEFHNWFSPLYSRYFSMLVCFVSFLTLTLI
jgi:hypothetical protein